MLGAVKARQAQPLHRAVGRDERPGVAIREERVVGDRRKRRAPFHCAGVIGRTAGASPPSGPGRAAAVFARRRAPQPAFGGQRASPARLSRHADERNFALTRPLEWSRVRSRDSSRVEASALPTRLPRGRAPLSAGFLRLRSDEQLVALFRAGSDDAFRAIHDRYRARLLAYARQMLHGAISDPEDALQDVFLRAYRALRAQRPPGAAAGLALPHRAQPLHRRAAPPVSRCRASWPPTPSRRSALRARPPSHRPSPSAARRSTRLVADVQTLPSQQRSALLMRELQGLSYEELGERARRLGAGGEVAAASGAHRPDRSRQRS